jgi:hypothetical protein
VDVSTTTLYLSPASQRAANVKRVRHLIDRQSTILIRLEFGELLVPPMPPVMAAPDLSEDEPACDGSTWQQDRPQVPGLHPGWPVAKVHCSAVVAASNHELLVRKQSRRAEYDAGGFAALGPDSKISGCGSRYRFRATPQRNSLVKLNAGAAG